MDPLNVSGVSEMNYPVKISVIMPVYNADIQYLREAAESILNQSFKDFELIIIDDGSTNGTWNYLSSLSDARIRLMQNKTNIGVTKSLNIGLKAARGEYIARMDADDISARDRLEKQLIYMEHHPETVMCGAAVHNIGDADSIHRTRIKKMDIYRIKTLFYYPGPLHPTMFIRHSILDTHGIEYDESLIYAQDYALCAELGKLGNVEILSDVLLKRRIHSSRITQKYYETQKQCSIKTQKKLLHELLDNITEEEAMLHYRFSYEKRIEGATGFFRCASWYMKLIRANNQKKIYPRIRFASYAIKLLALSTGQSAVPKAIEAIVSVRNKLSSRHP